MDFKLDQSGDIIINELNEIETIDDPDEIVSQDLNIYLQTQLGSNVFNPNRGIPWFEFSDMKKSEFIAKSLTRAGLDRHEMVQEVNDVSANLEGRNMKIECRVTTTEDTVITILLEE